ncbi:hypothetical protein [Rhodoplanes sp. Z2-YC6860]|uniref:hypothetical protein n=1 Tax=Rhodoplanes sp. Z2-YC6860 TaxID=674703 RepID=UPI0009FBA58E|nr:hypothetical protein [Rhodoplanes sp. Z2-YC6860]
MNRKEAFLADRRGAVAFEMMFVFVLLMISCFLPLADVAIAGFQYISAMEALRAFGQSIQYSGPTDLGDTSTWQTAALAKADSSYPISNFQLICGDTSAVCSAANTANPKYYSYQTSFTLSPIVLTSVLCPNGCTITLSYSERFQ